MQVCKICGSSKIENKDLSLCATHNKERLKAEKEPKEKKVYNLKRTPIKAISSATAARKNKMIAEQRKMKESGVRWCETCGKSDMPLSHSHILPEGEFSQFAHLKENQIYECYGASSTCHYIWENGTIEQKIAQSTFKRKCLVILKLAPEYLERMILNGAKGRDYDGIRRMVFGALQVGH